MSALSGEDKLIDSICTAAYRNDAVTIATYLGIEKNTTRKRQGDLDESLRASSTKANFLHAKLFESGKLCSDMDKAGQLLRALLLVPPWYETPWNAALALVRCFHTQSGFLKKSDQSRAIGVSRRQLLTFVTELQSFLQHSARAWLVPDHTTTTSTASLPIPASAANRTSLTPRIMFEKIARLVLDPVFQTSALESNTSFNRMTVKSKTENDHWSLPFELLPSLLSICRTLEPDEIPDSTTTTTSWIFIINIIFARDQSEKETSMKIRKDRLLQWLTLVSDTRSYFRQNDWIRLRQMLQRFFSWDQRDHDKIPSDDFPGLVRSTVSFLSHEYSHSENEGNNDDDTEENVSTWDELVLQVLYSATTHTAILFSTVEIVLKSSISSLSNLVLHQWIDSLMHRQREVERPSQIPDWVTGNLLLMLLQAAQQSGSQLVSDLVSQAFGNLKRGNLARRSWDILVSMAFSPPTSSNNEAEEVYPNFQGELKKSEDQIAMLDTIQAHMLDSYYGGNGQFFQHQNIVSSGMSYGTSLICQSLFLGTTSPDAAAQGKRHHHRIFCSERAQLWIYAIQGILRVSSFASTNTKACNRLNVQDMLLAVLVIVTVYIEIPDSRKSLVRTMMLEHFTTNKGRSTSQKTTVLAKLYCIGISTIIRSLERNNVHGGKLNTMDELKPLSDALGRSMPKNIFLHLASATIHLPSSRSALLFFAKDGLNSRGIWCDLTGNVGIRGENDRIECALHALCLLIVHFSTSERSGLSSCKAHFYDKCGREAWAIVSDIIILNRPSLSISARRLLFQRLQSCIEENELCNQKMSRLLRTCLMLFLRYCMADSTNCCLIFEPEIAYIFSRKRGEQPKNHRNNQREDFGALLRLILSLARNLETSTDLPDMLSTCRRRMFELLASNNTKSSSTTSKGLELRKRNDGLLAHSSSNIDLQVEDIFTLCFDAIMKCLLSSEMPRMSVADSTATVHRSNIWEIIRSKLQSMEQDSCVIDANCYDEDLLCTPKLPKWVQSKLQPMCLRCPETIDHDFLKPLLSSLSDVMIELVIGRNRPCNTENIEEVRHLLGNLCALVDMKRDYSKKIPVTEDTAASPKSSSFHFEQDTVHKIAPPFFDVASTALSGLMESCSYQSLEEADKIFHLALLFCSSIQRMMQGIHAKTDAIVESTRIFQSLWKFYCAVLDEESSKSFIRYLEATCLKDALNSLEGATSERGLLLAIKTDRELDAAVRHIRTELLMTMQSLFPIVAESHSQLGTNHRHPTTRKSSISVENPADGFFCFWCNCLRTFSMDLNLGVQGYSGGITTKMFQLLLDLIESSTNVILSKCNKSGARPTSQVGLDSRQAAVQLREVICKLPLKSSSKFKKILILSFHLLPSVNRALALIDLLNGVKNITGPSKSVDEFASTALEQCICLLERWDGSTTIQSLPWATTVDKEQATQLGNIDDSSHNSNSISHGPSGGQRSEQQFPSVVVVPTKGSTVITDEQSAKTINLDLKFASADNFSLAYCCALLSMEHKWRESYQIIQKMKESHLSIQDDNMVTYFTDRVNELSEVIRLSCLFFKSTSNNDLHRGEELKGSTMYIVAKRITGSGKLRLCSLLDRVATVLKKAIQKLIGYIQNSNATFDLAIAESLTCVMAWLGREEIDTDLSSGLRKWYKEENGNRSDRGLPGAAHEKSDASFVARLPKVLFHMEELDWSVQKLSEVCSRHLSSRVSDLDEFLGRVYETLSGDENAWSSSTVNKMIEQKLKMSESVESGIALIDTFAERAIDEEPTYKRKKSYQSRKLEQKMRKERRRRFKRSRNTVVDEMLQRDQEQGHDKGNEADDAYVDLEDFLAEG